MSGIPLSQIVNVVPQVLSPLNPRQFLDPLILTRRTEIVSAGSVLSVEDTAMIASLFGADSNEVKMCDTIFAGLKDVARRPGRVLFGGVSSDATGLATNLDSIAQNWSSWSGMSPAFVPTQSEVTTIGDWLISSRRYWAVIWDDNPRAILKDPGEDSTQWPLAKAVQDTGALCPFTFVYKDPKAAALALAWMATLDFDASNGRRVLAFVQSDSVTASVDDAEAAQNLLDGGYSFYGSYGAPTGDFSFFYNGRVLGTNLWADALICQIWLTNQLQYCLFTLFMQRSAIPFTEEGDAMITAACQDVISKAASFGMISVGVTLDAQQKNQLTQTVGRDISTELYNQGYYLVPGASKATPQQRAQRKIPGAILWYCDSGSVQSIDFSVVEVV